ncbi:hypothetical protein B0H13DRAFT_2667903 [Mycena leptocephala]|nr:hypothetical protein B0H13DRAFT_2667903 [Mycena leptocephala]
MSSFNIVDFLPLIGGKQIGFKLSERGSAERSANRLWKSRLMPHHFPNGTRVARVARLPFFASFLDHEAQCEMVKNYEEINRVIKHPKVKLPRERSKNPSVKKAPLQPVKPVAAPTKSFNVPPSVVVLPVTVAPPPPNPTNVGFVNAEPPKTEVHVPAPNLAANNASENKSGQTVEDLLKLVMKRIDNLELGQGAGKKPPKARADSPHREESSASQRPIRRNESPVPKARETHVPRGITPRRFAAENFFERALRGAPKTSARATGYPEYPSDDSSSDSDSHQSSDDEFGFTRRRAVSPRLSSKRRRGYQRKQKMLLKPIPPSRYNGEPDAIQRFARESHTYVTMGRVPENQQVYFVSYYLDGEALDFYNQVVAKDEQFCSTWPRIEKNQLIAGKTSGRIIKKEPFTR